MMYVITDVPDQVDDLVSMSQSALTGNQSRFKRVAMPAMCRTRWGTWERFEEKRSELIGILNGFREEVVK